MTQEQSKELVLTNSDVTAVHSKPARLISVGRREVSASGLRRPLLIYYIQHNAVEKFVSIAELSRVFCGASTIPGKKRVRAMLSSVAVEMALKYGQILIMETEGPHRRTRAVKLLNAAIPGERQAAMEQLGKWRSRGEISQKRYHLFLETLCKFQDAEGLSA